MVPGFAERERAPLREQRTDWMRLMSPPFVGIPLRRIGRRGHASLLHTALTTISPGRVIRVRSFRLRNAVSGQLLKGY